MPEAPDFDYDQGEVDAYLEYWHNEGEGQAQYDAWRDAEQPYDFTGASYLEEYTKPLREQTPLMERFDRRIGCSRDTSIELEEFTLEPDQDNLRFMLDVDEAIFEDGDHFLQQDPGFLDDFDKVDIVALGGVLAETSGRHGCSDFWPRLRALGPTPQIVREAKGWWLLANIELEPEHDFYSGRLEDAIAEFHPKVEKIVAAGGLAVEGFACSGWEVHSVIGQLSPSFRRDLLSAYLRRDKIAVEKIHDRAASRSEAKARKGNHKMFLRGRAKRVDTRSEPDTYYDTSFLCFASEWEDVASRPPKPTVPTRSIANRSRRFAARARQSRGRSIRCAGSRRGSTVSHSPGGGDDPPGSSDAPGEKPGQAGLARRLARPSHFPLPEGPRFAAGFLGQLGHAPTVGNSIVGGSQ